MSAHAQMLSARDIHESPTFPNFIKCESTSAAARLLETPALNDFLVAQGAIGGDSHNPLNNLAAREWTVIAMRYTELTFHSRAFQGREILSQFFTVSVIVSVTTTEVVSDAPRRAEGRQQSSFHQYR